METKKVQSPVAEIERLSESERKELAQEVLPILLTARAGLEEIDRSLEALSDEELDAVIERARRRAGTLGDEAPVAAIIHEAMRAVRISGAGEASILAGGRFHPKPMGRQTSQIRSRAASPPGVRSCGILAGSAILPLPELGGICDGSDDVKRSDPTRRPPAPIPGRTFPDRPGNPGPRRQACSKADGRRLDARRSGHRTESEWGIARGVRLAI